MKRIAMVLGLAVILASCGEEESVSPEPIWDGLYRVFERTDVDTFRNTCDEEEDSTVYGYLGVVKVEGASFTWCGVRSDRDSATWCGVVGEWNEDRKEAFLLVDSAAVTLVFERVRILGLPRNYFYGVKKELWPSQDCKIDWMVFGQQATE